MSNENKIKDSDGSWIPEEIPQTSDAETPPEKQYSVEEAIYDVLCELKGKLDTIVLQNTSLVTLFATAVQKLDGLSKPVVNIAPATNQAQPTTDNRQQVQTTITSSGTSKTNPLNEIPDHLKKQVSVTETEKEYILKGYFPNKGDFAQMIKIVKNQLRGDFISQGKDSYFKIPK